MVLSKVLFYLLQDGGVYIYTCIHVFCFYIWEL